MGYDRTLNLAKKRTTAVEARVQVLEAEQSDGKTKSVIPRLVLRDSGNT